MRATELERGGGRRTFVIVFDAGDEVAGGLLAFAREQALTAASFTAIGALRDVTLGFWNPDTTEYERIPIREQVEVLSLVGNVALAREGGPKVHAHIVVGTREGAARGGHLLEGHVRPTLEVVLVELPAHLRRTHDPATGLPLLDPGASG